jgi:hypothetical protein
MLVEPFDLLFWQSSTIVAKLRHDSMPLCMISRNFRAIRLLTPKPQPNRMPSSCSVIVHAGDAKSDSDDDSKDDVMLQDPMRDEDAKSDSDDDSEDDSMLQDLTRDEKSCDRRTNPLNVHFPATEDDEDDEEASDVAVATVTAPPASSTARRRHHRSHTSNHHTMRLLTKTLGMCIVDMHRWCGNRKFDEQ